MSFSGSRKIRIDRSTLNSFRDQHNYLTVGRIPDTEERYRRDGLSTIGIGEIIPEVEILSASGYRVHSARYRGRVVVVKVFHGPNSKKELTSTVALNKCMMHPHILHMIGISSPDTDVNFIVFDADCNRSVESVLASSLATDLTRSVSLGLKMIGSLSSGLQYLVDCCVPMTAIGVDNFDIIFGQNEKILITINPSGLEDLFLRPMWMPNSEDGWNVLDGLCRKTFAAINRILYREQLNRESDSNTSLPAHQLNSFTLTQVAAASTTLYESSEDPTTQTPRREYVWRSTDRGSSSLEDIASQFREYTDISTSPRRLRRLRACSLPQTHHRCKGYSREEITLTTDITQSAILSHTSPTPWEVCTICGEVVGVGKFLCVCGGDDDYVQPNIKCSVCSVWQHYACVVILPLGEQSFICDSCSVPRLPEHDRKPWLRLSGYFDRSRLFSAPENHGAMQPRTFNLQEPLHLSMESARDSVRTISGFRQWQGFG